MSQHEISDQGCAPPAGVGAAVVVSHPAQHAPSWSMESPPKIAVHGERHELATMRKYGSIGWHTFRHTYSTLHKALEAQQKLMRHADIRTTMDQYGETPMQTRWEATRKVIEIVFDRKSSSGEWSPEAEAGAVGARAS